MNYQKSIRIQLNLVILLAILFAAVLPSTLYSDGMIVVNDPHQRIFPPPRPRPIPLPRPMPPDFTPFPLEVRYHHVNVKIDGQVAITSVDQVFFNPTQRQLEGYYIFPIPANAVIKKFSMDINGKEVEAELLDAHKAREIYENIVRSLRDPALLEYVGQGLFKARIFPIEPRAEKRVKISYSQLLLKENNTVEYLYPLNTEKFSAKPLHDVAIHVEIQADEQIKNIYCPTHNAEIIHKTKTRAIVGYEEKNTQPDSDFKLYYSTDNEKLGFSLLSYKKERDEDGYFFLSLSPGYTRGDEEITEQDITFVLDVSGSMAGKNMKQAKKALLFCVENLNKGDRFEIIRFSTEAEALFNHLETVNEKNLQHAREFIEELKAIGGTNIDEALSMALKMEKRPGRPYMIIFLTDGKPTIGETDENTLVKKITGLNHAGTRIFTFGIGNEINTHLLDKITEFTRAYRTYITPEEDIEVKVSNFYANVQSPILTDLKLDFGPDIRVSKTLPRELPDLFKGSAITLLGRYKGEGDAKITLTGRVRDKEKQFTFVAPRGFKSANSSEKDKTEFIPSLWAARRVGYLLDQIRLHGESHELVEEVTQLARTFGIITPYTSYLIVEDERDGIRRNVLRDEDQTLAPIVQDHSFRKSEAEYSEMKSKSGAGSVQASKDVQQLNVATNYAQTRPGNARMNYTDQSGNTRNVTTQLKNIQGRAIYNTGKFWVDSHIQNQKQRNQSTQRIQFASTEYFTLLKKEPLSGQFLALGKNVHFVMNNTRYEIYE